MPLSMILSLVLPIASTIVKAFFKRMFNHGVSTATGVGAGALAVGFLSAIGCDLSAAQQGVIGGIAALPGLMGTDATTTAKSFVQVATEKAMLAKTAGESTP